MRVVLDMAEACHALQVAHQPQRLVVILADLVIGIAKPGFGHGHVGQRAVALGLHQRPGGSLAGPVEQGLRAIGFVDRLRLAGTGNQVVYLGGVVRHGASFPRLCLLKRILKMMRRLYRGRRPVSMRRR